MRKLLILFALVIFAHTTTSGQFLNYEVIDSINFSPVCIKAVDFDGDGLDEILAGTDSGVVAIDAISHEVLWYSSVLPVYVSAVAYIDVDGDSFKDVVAGTVNNGYWLNVIYGPDYSSLYTWGGYVNGRINEIFDGIEPDSLNILIFTQVSSNRGIYSIDVNTWDYTFNLRPVYMIEKIGSLFATVITLRTTEYFFYRYYGGVHFLNSNLTPESSYDFRLFDAYEIIRNFGIGTVGGLFFNNNPATYVSAAYFENEGIIFEAFDEELEFVSEVVSNRTIPVQNFKNSHIYRIDDAYSMIDDVLLVSTYGNLETSIIAVYYDGHQMQEWGYLETDVPGFGKACMGNLYQSGEEVFVSKGQNKIYTSRFYLPIVNIEDEEVNYPESFMAMTVYPNPFNEHAQVALKLDESAFINISIYDITGRKVDEIYDGLCDRGVNRFSCSGEILSSGVYFVTARSADYVVSSKAVLLK